MDEGHWVKVMMLSSRGGVTYIDDCDSRSHCDESSWVVPLWKIVQSCGIVMDASPAQKRGVLNVLYFKTPASWEPTPQASSSLVPSNASQRPPPSQPHWPSSSVSQDFNQSQEHSPIPRPRSLRRPRRRSDPQARHPGRSALGQLLGQAVSLLSQC